MPICFKEANDYWYVVFPDGGFVRIDLTPSFEHMRYYKSDGTFWSVLNFGAINYGGSSYDARSSNTINSNVIPIGNQCVIAELSHDYYLSSTSLSSATGDNTFWRVNVYFFDDYFFYTHEFNTDGSAVNLSNVSQVFLVNLESGLTNGGFLYNVSGSESTSDATITTHEYFGVTSDELDIMVAVIDNNSSAGFNCYLSGDYFNARYDDDSLSGGDSITFCGYFDSSEKSGGKAHNSAAARQAIFSELKDITLETLTKGSRTTNWKDPLHIGTGKCSDGLQHITLDGTDDNIQIGSIERSNTIARSFAVDTPQFLTGSRSAPTNHLLASWSFEESAANTTLAEDSGDSNWQATLNGGDNTSAKSVSGARGNAQEMNGTDDYIALPAYNETDWRNCYSFFVRFKPLFVYNDSTYYRVFVLGDQWNNYIDLRWNPVGDSFYFAEGAVNGTGHYSISSDEELQQWHDLVISVDRVNGIMFSMLNGDIDHDDANTSPGTDSVNYILLGKGNGSNYSNTIFDSAMLLKGFYRPYGSFITDSDGNYTNYDRVLGAYVKCSESNNDSLLIGTGSITVGSNVGTTTGVDGETCWDFSNGDTNLFDANNLTVEFPSSNMDSLQGAIAFWYKEHNDTVEAGYSSLMGHSSATYALRVRRPSMTQIEYHIDSTNSIITSAGFDLADNRWHWLVFYYDFTNNIFRWWYDGVLMEEDSTLTPTAPTLSSGNMILGNYADRNRSCIAHMGKCYVLKGKDCDYKNLPTIDGKPMLINKIGVA